MHEDATSRLQLHDDPPRPHVYEGKPQATIPTAALAYLSYLDIVYLHDTQGEYWEGSLTRNTSALQPLSSGLQAQLSPQEALVRRLINAYPSQAPHLESRPLLKSAQSHHLCFL